MHLKDDVLTGTVNAFYTYIKSNKWLSEKNIKTPAVALRIYVYEQWDSTIQIHDSSSDDEITIVNGKAAKRKLRSGLYILMVITVYSPAR